MQHLLVGVYGLGFRVSDLDLGLRFGHVVIRVERGRGYEGGAWKRL
jgi:hypothetical protein